MIAAIVPVKVLCTAKSRLAVHLSDTERGSLVLRLLNGVVTALRDSADVGIVAVATEERAVADSMGAVWLPDGGSLNATLERGSRWATNLNASALLILPADLPYVTGKDVRALIAERQPAPSVVVAPSYDGGTGGLLLSPPDAIRFAFGPNSARRHANFALSRNISLRTVRRDAFWRDLDTFDDLVGWWSAIEKGHTGDMASTGASQEANR